MSLVWCNIKDIEIRGAARSNDSIALIKLPCLYMSCKWPISPDLNSQVGDPDSILSEKKFQLLLFRERGKFPRLKNVKIIQRITIKHRKYLNSLATNAIIKIVFKKNMPLHLVKFSWSLGFHCLTYMYFRSSKAIWKRHHFPTSKPSIPLKQLTLYTPSYPYQANEITMCFKSTCTNTLVYRIFKKWITVTFHETCIVYTWGQHLTLFLTGNEPWHLLHCIKIT